MIIGLYRQDWMINRGPGFLAVIWFGSTPTPFPLSHQQVATLSQSSCVSLIELTDGRGGREWAWSRIIRPQESLAFYKSFNTLWYSSLVRMRSRQVVRVSDCQWTSYNGPGFVPSIRRHSRIWGAADEAVLNKKKRKQIKNPKNMMEKILSEAVGLDWSRPGSNYNCLVEYVLWWLRLCLIYWL